MKNWKRYVAIAGLVFLVGLLVPLMVVAAAGFSGVAGRMFPAWGGGRQASPQAVAQQPPQPSVSVSAQASGVPDQPVPQGIVPPPPPGGAPQPGVLLPPPPGGAPQAGVLPPPPPDSAPQPGVLPPAPPGGAPQAGVLSPAPAGGESQAGVLPTPPTGEVPPAPGETLPSPTPTEAP
ncbi:MAG TPA: hypothetical protein ENJ54_03485 [Chloroflexi bacterium]|nr:hypothetical protein [Chloroflexota bacterium]